MCTVWRSVAAGFRLNNVSLPGSMAGGAEGGRTESLGWGGAFPCVDADTHTTSPTAEKIEKSPLFFLLNHEVIDTLSSPRKHVSHG